MENKIYDSIRKLKGIKIYKNVNVKDENNMKISAEFLYKVEIDSFENIKKLFFVLKENNIKYYILGNGSNVLFANDYYDGVLIKLNGSRNKDLRIVNAGEKLNYLNDIYIKNSIYSLNFLVGVPCSIGGAIYMNAGAFNESISDIIEYVYILDLDDLKIKVLNNKECDFKYRDSYFKHHNVLILGAKIKLKYLNINNILEMKKEYLKIRCDKLPLEYPNLGSIFKNPPNYYVGKLVDELGLKGTIMGGAMISKKHGNVIVNFNNAKYEDVLDLMNLIKTKIYIKYKIVVEEEIIVFK